ncbi:MAG TPA: TonB-dependent receptor [Gemmatimonadales bacterium]|nr:TonB-dependent receptor [Gemmatimonadales bacterium]
MAGGVVVLGTCLAGSTPAPAQDRPAQPRDSLAPVRLSEVVISAPTTAPAAPTAFTMSRVSVTEIQARAAFSVAQIATLIPAAHVQTNSRGESLVYLRNAGERQVAVLMDGALLNVPWDWRADMSLVPAAMVGGVSIAKGVPPVEYGTNVLGGAINLASRIYERTAQPVTEVEMSYGSEQQLRGVLSHRASRGRVAFATSLGYASTDAMPLPRSVSLPFSQPDPSVRTNTDSRIANGFGRLVYMMDNGSEFGVTLLHLDAEKGVAPEGHRDPTTSAVRFWRYPTWRSSAAIFSGEGTLRSQTTWKGALWASRFEQTIDQYTSAAYDSLDARQEDHDLTFGTRLVGQHHLTNSAVKLAVNALTSTHRQRDLDLLSDGAVATGTFPTLEYQQHILSAGLEYELRAVDPVILTAGASYDASFSPRTGDKPAHDPLTDYSATLGAAWDPGGPVFVRGSVGRKTRFPTMRELFGESLNRFLINPGLEPEYSVLAEVAVGLRSPRLSGEIIPFGTFTSNTIDQRNVTLPGETRPRRERINLRGSRVLGVEIAGAARPRQDLQVEGHLTFMHVRRLQALPADPTRLSEKPDALGRLSLTYSPVFGFRTQVEAVYTGRAFSLDDNDAFVPLARSLVLNTRLGYRFELPDLRSLELFVYVANLADQLVEPQLGLPGAGRSVQGGLRADL